MNKVNMVNIYMSKPETTLNLIGLSNHCCCFHCCCWCCCCCWCAFKQLKLWV